VVVFHDASSGLALYPNWGPLNGDHAVSEQRLAAEVFDQLPADSTVIADRNFGVFSMAWEVTQRRRGLILRLTEKRAKKVFGSAISSAGDYPVTWQASRWDKCQVTTWPPGASLQGRLIATRVGRGKSKTWLYLFTSLSLPAEEVIAIYSKRWNIETDLRSLKRTVQLQQLRSRSVDGVEKELLTAICAYDLVRAMMCLAARRSGIPVRRLSFTQTLDVVNDLWPGLRSTAPKAAYELAFQQVLDWIAATKLPNRSKPRSFPHEVWSRGYRFPSKKTK
jgi:hypothetical protein